MTHRIVFLGAGYAGVPAARRLANQVRADEVTVTMVNAAPDFVERPRLHQLSTGQDLRTHSLRRLLGPKVNLVVGTVTALDLDEHVIEIDGAPPLAYDTLVYGLGSTIDVGAVPGIVAHAHAFTGPRAAGRLAADATNVAGRGGTFVVCGGGLTGIEAATELAESYPDLAVTLVSGTEPGAWLSTKARAHLGTAFDRLGITVRAGVRITEIRAGELRLASGGQVPFDGCVWAGGFTVPALAAKAGLDVDRDGRILLDDTLRSRSHPEAYAVGDAAAASGSWGESLSMGCRSGGFTGPYVADAIADRLAGREPKPFRFRYFHECVSLGRKNGVIQFLRTDETPKRNVLTGRLAARYKDIVLSSAIWLFHRPGPYLPRVRRVA